MHKTRLVQYGKMSAEIDENIADLILLCWKHGIKTIMSCENNVPKNWVWINFEFTEDLEKFVSIVSLNKENQIYFRIYPEYGFSYKDGGWKYDYTIIDYGMIQEIVIKDGKEYIEDISIGKSIAKISPSFQIAKEKPH